MLLVSFRLGCGVVPLAVMLGLVYVNIRRAGGMEKGGSVASGPLTPPLDA